MTSDREPVHVWAWLPGATGPTLAGRLLDTGGALAFQYASSWLGDDRALSLYTPELPLVPGVLPLGNHHLLPGCIRDASPDQWGRRVIQYRLLGRKGREVETADLDERTYLLASDSDRFGAIDFQAERDAYVPRADGRRELAVLQAAAEGVDAGEELSPDLAEALHHGTSLGGAFPKAMVEDDTRKYLAKFSCRSDTFRAIEAEALAMRLAREVGIDVARSSLLTVNGRDVLLVERFDRVRAPDGWCRRFAVSALTMLGLVEEHARYASYEALASHLRRWSRRPAGQLRELFARLVFNVLVGNTDDHARNHAAFWDGAHLALTPAYDLCPQRRHGGEANQAMAIRGEDRSSRLATCLDAARSVFLVPPAEAREIVARQLTVIGDRWREVGTELGIGAADLRLLWGRQLLNPSCYEDDRLDPGIRSLAETTKRGKGGI